jgi:predicted metal-dependent enzyme (double-stranded beta helix superfamily)
MLGQVAQASRDARLLEVVEMLHRQLLSQIKWLKGQIKEATPQVLLA